MKICILLFYIVISISCFAKDCESQRAALKNELYSNYQLNEKRIITKNVINNLTEKEHLNLFELSEIFNSISHDTPDHQTDRYLLQDKAKMITRAAVTRSGYTIINPDSGDPFDALIEEVDSTYGIDVTTLLVLKTPLPHVTLWFYRRDPQHNPYKIISLKIKNDPQEDTVTWWLPDFSKSRTGSINQFVENIINCTYSF